MDPEISTPFAALHRGASWSLLCLALGAYMSAAETAITGASRPRMHRLAQQGNKRAALVNRLLDRKDEAVSAVLLGNSVVNILSASLTTAVLTSLFGAAGVVYATIVVGVLVVIFAEVMPKTWALLRADRVALILAPSIVVTLAILGADGARRRLDLADLSPPAGRAHDAAGTTRKSRPTCCAAPSSCTARARATTMRRPRRRCCARCSISATARWATS